MLKNCMNCGKLHTYPTRLCKDCLEEKIKKYKKVKNYLWDHPNSTIDTVSEKTGIKKEKIIQFVREDRFIVTDGILEDPKAKIGF
ncbi:MAG: hypothetical protein ACOCRX_09370 [Candidatus Woesearchaeota archaeon]